MISECLLISDELVPWQKTLDACEVSKTGGILLDDSQQFTHHPVHKKKYEHVSKTAATKLFGYL